MMLREGDAAIFNMSLLTSDFFGVLSGMFLFHETLTPLYFIGFLFIISGLIVYSKSTPPTTDLIMSDGTKSYLLPKDGSKTLPIV